MSHVLLKSCTGCREYTLSDVCPRCGKKALPNRPAKFSPEDNYGEYRRRLKKLDAAKGPGNSASERAPHAPILPGAANPSTSSVASVTSVDGHGKARRSTDDTDGTDGAARKSGGPAKSADGSPKPTPSGKPAPKRP